MHHTTAAQRPARAATCAALPLAVAALLGQAAPAYAANYTGTITGVAAHDQAGGSGGYVPGYVIQASGGTLHYVLGSGDTIQTATSVVSDISGISLTTDGASAPVSLDVGNGSGALGISAVRSAVGTWGVAAGIDTNGVGFTAHGNLNVYAQSDDATPNSTTLGVRVQRAPAVFEGNTKITTYTPGYSQGLYVFQGAVDFNGTALVQAQARGTNLCGVYNSGGGASRVSFNHGVTISALAIHPSDNVHGVYNDNQNSRFVVTGDLQITAAAQGSTVFGVRNQGVLIVSGTTQVTATGSRSALGMANTHRTARMEHTGDVTISVTNTGSYVPFGNPTGIQNLYSGSSYAHYAGAVHASVQAATEAYALDNQSEVQFNATTRPVTLNVVANCTGCDVYGIRNQGGSVQAAGGMSVSLRTGGKTHAIWNVAAGNRNGVVGIGGGLVQLTGDVVTGALAAQTGTASTTLDLATPLSFLHGSVTGYQGADSYYDAGATSLHLGARATWRPDATALAADFGGGTLHVDGLGVIDASPASTGALVIDGSGAVGTGVVLADQATLAVHSDVAGINGPASAGRIVFGGHVASFAASGTQLVAVADDPLLAAGTLPDVSVETLHAMAPVVVADASQAGAGTATFAAVAGVSRALPALVAGAARTALVRPAVALTADHRQVVMSGLWIRVLPADSIFQNGFE